MNELFASPAAGFDDPLEILDGCHGRIRRQCAMIERIAAHVAVKGADAEALAAARNVMRYFDDAGRNHHLDEEEDLFPALRAQALAADRDTLENLIERLLAEHVGLDAAWKAMRERLAGLGAQGPALEGGFARAFAETYERHIVLEENELLPLARRVLPAAAIERLGRAMAARRGVRIRGQTPNSED